MGNAVSNIEAAIPLLLESTRKLERNPNDKKAQQDLQDLLAKLEEPVSLLGTLGLNDVCNKQVLDINFTTRATK